MKKKSFTNFQFQFKIYVFWLVRNLLSSFGLLMDISNKPFRLLQRPFYMKEISFFRIQYIWGWSLVLYYTIFSYYFFGILWGWCFFARIFRCVVVISVYLELVVCVCVSAILELKNRWIVPFISLKIDLRWYNIFSYLFIFIFFSLGYNSRKGILGGGNGGDGNGSDFTNIMMIFRCILYGFYYVEDLDDGSFLRIREKHDIVR